MTQEGVIKVRSYCRKTEDERWDGEELDLVMGVPWEPIPGRGHIQVKSRVKFMEESGEKIRDPWEWEEPKARRISVPPGSKEMMRPASLLIVRGPIPSRRTSGRGSYRGSPPGWG